MTQPTPQADPYGAATIGCPHCRQTMRVARAHMQVMVACPHCGQMLEPWRIQAAASGDQEPPPAVPPGAGPRPGMAGLPKAGAVSSRNKVVAGLLGIFLGGLGVHRFYLGHIGIGVIQILVTIAGSITCCFPVGALWGFVEGILCFTGHLRDVDGLPLRD